MHVSLCFRHSTLPQDARMFASSGELSPLFLLHGLIALTNNVGSRTHACHAPRLKVVASVRHERVNYRILWLTDTTWCCRAKSLQQYSCIANRLLQNRASLPRFVRLLWLKPRGRKKTLPTPSCAPHGILWSACQEFGSIRMMRMPHTGVGSRRIARATPDPEETRETVLWYSHGPPLPPTSRLPCAKYGMFVYLDCTGGSPRPEFYSLALAHRVTCYLLHRPRASKWGQM